MTATRVRLARARLQNYEWSYSPRSEFAHTGTLFFPKRANCAGDKDADLWDAITPCLEAIEGKYSVRHRDRKRAAEAGRQKQAAIQAVAGDGGARMQALVIQLRRRQTQIKGWWDNPTASGVPLAPPVEGAGTVPAHKLAASWMIAEFRLLRERIIQLEEAMQRYNRLAMVACASLPTVWDEDDRAFVEQAGDDVDAWNMLLETFPAVVKHHVPVWATVSCGRDATTYRIGDNSAGQADGIWFATRDALRSKHRYLFTRTGRLRRGAFTGWSGSSRRTADEWLTAIADDELFEYASYANGSAVDVVLEVLDVGATLRGISPGMVDVAELDKVLEAHGLPDTAEGFDGADTERCGPWYRTNRDNDFDVATMVKDALPSVGQEVEQYFHREWKLGYADDPGVWHYFAYEEAVQSLEQLELPL